MIDFKNKYVFIYEIAQKESRLLMTKRLLLTGPRHRSRERERQKKKKKKKKKRRTGQWRVCGSVGKARGGECGANDTRPRRISVLASGFIFTTI